MTNEWNEFLSYTSQPVYAATGKRDTAYLGRFTCDMLEDFIGFGRVLTILARGFLYHDRDGNLLIGSAYDRVGYARRALCAWCSVPEKQKSSEHPVDFRELSAEFPELVNEKGEGWLVRHVRGIVRFVRKHPELVDKRPQTRCAAISKGFTAQWKKRVRQLQVPIFAGNTKGAWVHRFDDLIAEALEEGPLRMEEYPLPEDTAERIAQFELNPSEQKAAAELVRYYLANRREDTPWVVLPVTNFDAYFGTTAFSKKWLPKLPKELIERSTSSYGVSRFRIAFMAESETIIA